MLEFKDLPASPFTDTLDRAFHIKNNFLDVGNGCILPKRYRDISEQVRKLKIRSDDVFLCSLPRTGSTWMQEILWLLVNDLDYEKAGKIDHLLRTPTLELSALFSDDKEKAAWIE